MLCGTGAGVAAQMQERSLQDWELSLPVAELESPHLTRCSKLPCSDSKAGPCWVGAPDSAGDRVAGAAWHCTTPVHPASHTVLDVGLAGLPLFRVPQ